MSAEDAVRHELGMVFFSKNGDSVLHLSHLPELVRLQMSFLLMQSRHVPE